jgi:pre-mRNA-processing factor SLU7
MNNYSVMTKFGASVKRVKTVVENEDKKTSEEKNNEHNTNVPYFIAAEPWYLVDKKNKDEEKMKKKEKKSEKEWSRNQIIDIGPSTKYRKGSCENCGANHKTKDCVERPRKKGAKYTGEDIASDRIVKNVALSFEGKRDRWNGYDGYEHEKAIKEHEELEEIRKRKRKEKKIFEKTEKKDKNSEDLDIDDLTDSDEEDGEEETKIINIPMEQQLVRYLMVKEKRERPLEI